MKKEIVPQKASSNDKNPSSYNRNNDFETLVKVLPWSILEEHLKEIQKDYKFLKDEPLETRKEEAIRPMYLIRYE